MCACACKYIYNGTQKYCVINCFKEQSIAISCSIFKHGYDLKTDGKSNLLNYQFKNTVLCVFKWFVAVMLQNQTLIK